MVILNFDASHVSLASYLSECMLSEGFIPKQYTEFAHYYYYYCILHCSTATTTITYYYYHYYQEVAWVLPRPSRFICLRLFYTSPSKFSAH